MEINKETYCGGLYYWKKKVPNDIMFSVKILKKYNEISARNENPFPYLLELYEKYPDAPDIMGWLASEYQREHEYLKALQIYAKLIELNPNVIHFRKCMESCKAWIEADSMPETEETLEWLRQKMIEIWK